MSRMILIAAFVLSVDLIAAAQTPTVHFEIDPAQPTRPISKYIYGINRSLDGAYANLTLARVGGNRWTAYNWTNNASNAGNDYQFENDAFLGGGNTPGGAVISSIENAAAHHAALILTIPIAGYVSADKNPPGDVRKTGADYLTKRFRPEKPAKNAPFTTTPDPNSPVVYQDEFVNWLKTRYPASLTDPSRPIFFDLDNEPGLWSSTHAEIHPAAPTYAEMIERTTEYAKAIKAVEPDAKIFGPVSYGWQDIVKLQNAADANGRDFLSFYLAEMKKAEQANGKRLLDVLDVHWYPEATGGGVRVIQKSNNPAVAAARVQAPRSLWDKTYVESSWITRSNNRQPIALLPALQKRIADNYPDTKLSITEYNFGGPDEISGAIAEADVLGIFGQEGVFAACLWPLANREPYIAGGFQMYRNFDGHNGAFGDLSIAATTDNLLDTSIYASADEGNRDRIVLIAINRASHPISAQTDATVLPPKWHAEVYQLTAKNPMPVKAGIVENVSGSSFSYEMPAMSVSTIVISAK